MTLHPMKLVTIVVEAFAREPIVRLLAEVGAHGYTLIHVEGSGSKGDRIADLPESANIKFKVIVAPETSERLLTRLHADFFPRYAMVAYESDIRVLRPEKF